MKRTIAVVIMWMVAVWVTAAVIGRQAPVSDRPYTSANPLHRWDAAFYESLVAHTPQPHRQAFFPLFPAVVNVIMLTTGASFNLTASILNAVATIAACGLLAATKRPSTLDPKWLALGVVAMPASFVLLAPYPTALLLLSASLGWWGHVRRQPLTVAVASSLALLSHATGLVIALAGLWSVLRTPSRTSRRLFASAIIAGTAAAFLFSGRFQAFLQDQRGLTLFSGVPFWKLGWWYVSHPDATGWAVLTIAAILFSAGCLLLAVWRQTTPDRWLVSIALGLFVLAVLSGAWPSIPRYLLPSLLIPFWLARQRRALRWGLVVFSFLLQTLWLYGFVTWDAHV